MDLAIKRQKRISGEIVKLQSFINISRIHYSIYLFYFILFFNWNTSFRDKGKNPYLSGLGAK